MTIDLTSAEFRQLLDMVYIGNWVLNSAAATTASRSTTGLKAKFSACGGTPLSALVEEAARHLVPVAGL